MDLERKVETLTSSKAHYKQEWGRALKELFKLKQAVQMRQEAEMRKQQQQLEHMRLVHLAAEERKVAHKEKDEIEELKMEISKCVILTSRCFMFSTLSSQKMKMFWYCKSTRSDGSLIILYKNTFWNLAAFALEKNSDLSLEMACENSQVCLKALYGG